MNEVTNRKGSGNRVIVAVCAAGAVCAGAAARPPSGYQKMVGDGTALSDTGWGVAELAGGNLLGMGETFDYGSGIFESKQSVTRFTPDGLPVWSYLFDWGAQTDKALEAVEFDGDLVVAGCSFRNSPFSPGADFSNRMTLMRLDQNGGVVWSNRYPGGALPPGNTFSWDDLEGQVAVCVAPVPTPGRGVPVEMELVTASLHREGTDDPISGQFMRVNGAGAVTALVRYLTPPAFQSNALPFFAIAHDPVSGSFVVGGYVPYLDAPLTDFKLDPTVVRLSADGMVQQAWRLPIEQPEAGGSPGLREPVTTSLVMDPGGDVYAAGVFRYAVSNQIRSNTWIARMNPTTGQIAWIKQLTFLTPGVRSLSLNAQGELCIVGGIRQPESVADAYIGPAMAVIDSVTGALIRARWYRPSGFGELQDGVAMSSGGWQLFGTGATSGYMSGGLRGGFDPSVIDLYLVRTIATGQSGCHDGDLSIQTYDLDLQQAVAFPTIALVLPGQAQVQDVAPEPVMMDGENDCLFVNCSCYSDATGDGLTDFNDITAILSNWLTDYGLGETGEGDANCDSVVDFNDITTVLSNWLNDCFPMGP